MATSYQDVVNFLSTATLTQDQQNALVRVWNARMKQVRTMKKVVAISRLRAGQKVSFPVKGGGTAMGTIEKVMRTNCWVNVATHMGGPANNVHTSRYYCPANCLTVIA